MVHISATAWFLVRQPIKTVHASKIQAMTLAQEEYTIGDSSKQGERRYLVIFPCEDLGKKDGPRLLENCLCCLKYLIRPHTWRLSIPCSIGDV